MPQRPVTFRSTRRPSEASRRQENDKRRGSARERGYSARWDREAAAFRAAHPLCCGCQAIGRVEPATVVDHVEPHRGDQALFWDRLKWQSACDWHHNVVKKQLEAAFDAGDLAPEDLRLDSPAAVELTARLLGLSPLR